MAEEEKGKVLCCSDGDQQCGSLFHLSLAPSVSSHQKGFNYMGGDSAARISPVEYHSIAQLLAREDGGII